MTLTLHNEEVQQYFDMRDDIEYYKNKVQELEERLHRCVEDPTEADIDEMETQTETDMFRLPSITEIIAAYEEGEVREDRKGRNWDDLDLHIIRMAVGKDHPAFTITSLAYMLDRTPQAITSKAIELGFHTKRDRIRYHG